MRRRLTILVLFLLAGAVVNIAVAWACLFVGLVKSATWTGETTPTAAHVCLWKSVVPDEFPDEPNCFSTACGFGCSIRELSWREQAELQSYLIRGPAPYELKELRIGLPLRCMTMVRATKYTRTGPSAWHGETAAERGGLFPLLPFHPAWPEFTINTIMQALFLWLCVRSTVALFRYLQRYSRRETRRKRGRCLRCGYDLRGNLAGGCPECGWNREEAEA